MGHSVGYEAVRTPLIGGMNRSLAPNISIFDQMSIILAIVGLESRSQG